MYKLRDLMDLYRYEQESDDIMLLLADYTLDSRLDKDIMDTTILAELGDLYPYYNTTTTFKFFLEEWFKRWGRNITKLTDTVFAEYDILTNRDLYRHEERDVDDTTTDDRTITTDDDFTQTVQTDSERDIHTVDAEDIEVNETEQEKIKKTTAEDVDVKTDDDIEMHDSVTETKKVSTADDKTETVNESNVVVTDRDTTDKNTGTRDLQINETGENQVSAFNVATYQPQTKSIIDRQEDEDTTSNSTGTEDITETTTHTNRVVDDRDVVEDTTDSTTETKTSEEDIHTVTDRDMVEESERNRTEKDTTDRDEDVRTDDDFTETESTGSERDIKEVTADTLKLIGNRDMDWHEWGKAGDQLYAEMLEAERKLWGWNIYMWIVQKLERELFLGVY